MMNFAALAGGRQGRPLQLCPTQEQLRCPPWEKALWGKGWWGWGPKAVSVAQALCSSPMLYTCDNHACYCND